MGKKWCRSNSKSNGIKWVNDKYIEEELDHANLLVLTRKY